RVPHTYSFPTTRLPPRSTLFPYTTLFRSLAMYARVNFPKFAKVLESYVKNRGKEAVIAAAFTFLSYGYFLEDIRIDMFVFKGLEDRKSTRLNSSHVSISYAVFCLKKKKKQ